MKEDAGQVLFLSDLYAPEMGPTPASRGESREWTYIRVKQSWHSLLYVTPSVPQTGLELDIWEQSGDSVICSQIGCGREEGKEGTQGYRGREEEPRGSAWSQKGCHGRARFRIHGRASVGPGSMKPTIQGPLACLFVCACITMCVAVTECTYAGPLSAEPKYTGIKVYVFMCME